MSKFIDNAVYQAGVRSANRHTRRSFFGRVAGATATLAVGSAVYAPGSAMAVCSGSTITCNRLYGGNHNYCSVNTCKDGSWTVSPSSCDAVSNCGSRRTRWRDCCAGCGCHTAYGYPSCCSNCIYAGDGTGGGPCNPSSKVRCRYWGCV